MHIYTSCIVLCEKLCLVSRSGRVHPCTAVLTREQGRGVTHIGCCFVPLREAEYALAGAGVRLHAVEESPVQRPRGGVRSRPTLRAMHCTPVPGTHDYHPGTRRAGLPPRIVTSVTMATCHRSWGCIDGIPPLRDPSTPPTPYIYTWEHDHLQGYSPSRY